MWTHLVEMGAVADLAGGRFSARAPLDGKAPDVRPTPTTVSTMFARMVASAGTERQATVVRVYQDGEASTARNPLCHYHPHEHPLKTTVHYANTERAAAARRLDLPLAFARLDIPGCFVSLRPVWRWRPTSRLRHARLLLADMAPVLPPLHRPMLANATQAILASVAST